MKTSISELGGQPESERRSVSFDSYDITVRQLIEMFENSEITIPPEYQRQFVWDDERQSQLIESIFLGIPMPNIFMATNTDSTWEIVDGVQRVSTVSHYVGRKASLKLINLPSGLRILGLKKLSSINGYNYEQLPKNIQLMFETRSIRVTVLNDKSDKKVRFDLFERLNTGGIALTAQEIRNCVFRGPYNENVKNLAGDVKFRKLVKLRPRDVKNGTTEEFVLRFFAYLNGYRNFDHSVEEFLNDHLENNSNTPIPRKQLELFDSTLTVLRDASPDGIHRGNRSLTPVNLFEAVSVGSALVIKSPGKGAVKLDKLRSVVDAPGLKQYTTVGTNSRKAVRGRIEFVRDNIV